jgi:pyruvate formate lyase activating enzyme
MGCDDMVKSLIMNIQRYSIHDGGGIRTLVFFKGCPLRCPWCANPESQSFNQELIRKSSLCIGCSSEDCFKCTQEPRSCPTGALDIIGIEMTVEEAVLEVQKDLIFYDSTGGGVTLSGGEPLSHGDFALELLKKLKQFGIHTALETSGFGAWEVLDNLSDYLDLILFDLKIMDHKKSLEILEADNSVIKENFIRLIKKGAHVIPRIPLIPGYTMDDNNINAIIGFVLSQNLRSVHLLPFHQYGSGKYEGLAREYTLSHVLPPVQREIDAIKSIMEGHGLSVKIGG